MKKDEIKKNAPSGAKRPTKELVEQIATQEALRKKKENFFYPDLKYDERDGDWEED